MGKVYRARDRDRSRGRPQGPAGRCSCRPDRLASFRREAQLRASLNHPGIAAIHGFERAGGVPALVLALVEGETLDGRLAHGPLRLGETAQIARQIGDALVVAHGCGIVHRDLEPANVKVRPDGTGPRDDGSYLIASGRAYASTVMPALS